MAATRPALSLEEVARYPLPGTAVPAAIAFSPGDSTVTCLLSPDRSLNRQLVAFDIATGERRVLAGAAVEESDLSLEEKLRRERLREISTGVTRYAWAERADRVMVAMPDGVHLIERDGLRLLVDAPALDPQLSPDGSKLAFVRDRELHVVDVARDSPPRALTAGAATLGVTRGLAEFIAQEEMGRQAGFWWSDDGSMIAFAEVDESHIPPYRIVHQGSDEVGPSAQEDHRYPFAGAANARVRLGVVGRDGGDPVWMDIGRHEYLARVHWSRDGFVFAQVEDREQRALEVRRLDPATGEATVLLTETSDVWINLHNLFRPLRDGRFLWASERSGFRHLELRARDGSLIRELTSGPWLVDSVASVDEDGAVVWFVGTLDGPLERHLYSVSLEGGEPRRATSEAGTHAVVVSHDHRLFVDSWSSLSSPPVVTLKSLRDGSIIRTLHDDVDPRVEILDLAPPALSTFETRDGETLHAAVFLPEGEGPFPTIVSVYGGPHAQLVVNAWTLTVAMRAQYLRSLGFAVLVADNRGSAGRGLAFEAAVRHNLGGVEVDDQVDAVAWLVERGVADPERIGIYGWSYGGYMAARCLAKAPDAFSAAVAGAPVADWDGYDTHYTERYMGTPASNPDGYERSSLLPCAGQITGRLLIIHGLIDENVHFRHTARLVNALIRGRVPYELMLYPDERHLPRHEADRVHMEERIRDFFLDALRQ